MIDVKGNSLKVIFHFVIESDLPSAILKCPTELSGEKSFVIFCFFYQEFDKNYFCQYSEDRGYNYEEVCPYSELVVPVQSTELSGGR